MKFTQYFKSNVLFEANLHHRGGTKALLKCHLLGDFTQTV